MPQIVAAKYPVHFLNTWIMYAFYHVCTFIEATGLTHACWVLSYLIGKAAGVNVLHIPTGYNCLEATVFNAHPVVMPAEEKIVCGGTRGVGVALPPHHIPSGGSEIQESPHYFSAFLLFRYKLQHLQNTLLQWCGNWGAGGARASPKVLICQKSGQNPRKFGHRHFGTFK